MQIDLRIEAAGRDLEADVLVAGAGPAGITVARELARAGTNVLLVEAGGLTPEPPDPTAGTADSDLLYPDALAGGRSTGFGGTANLWVHWTWPDDGRRRARMLRPRPVDLEPRPGFRDGWPLTIDQLEPYLRRAHDVCELGPYGDDPSPWATDRAPLLEFPSGELETVLCRYAAGDVFAVAARDELARSEACTLVLGGTVVAFDVDGAGTIRGVRIASASGHVTARAKEFVVAMGGVENARTLLEFFADADGPPPPVVLGRGFMEHLEFRVGRLVPADRSLLSRAAFYDLHWVGGSIVSGMLAITPDVLRDDPVLPAMAFLLIAKPKGLSTPAERA